MDKYASMQHTEECFENLQKTPLRKLSTQEIMCVFRIYSEVNGH